MHGDHSIDKEEDKTLKNWNYQQEGGYKYNNEGEGGGGE